MLEGVFNKVSGLRGGYNFKRHLAKAGPRLSGALSQYDPALPDLNIVIRPATATDMDVWAGWKSHPDYNRHRVCFDWARLMHDDENANHAYRRRICVAFTANDELCGFSHMMMAQDGHFLATTQMEGRPGPHPLKGALGYCAVDTLLSVAQGIGCGEIWRCGPFYNPVAAAQCAAQGFKPYDDGMYTHYTMNIDRDTQFDPALFLLRPRRAFPAAEPCAPAP